MTLFSSSSRTWSAGSLASSIRSPLSRALRPGVAVASFAAALLAWPQGGALARPDPDKTISPPARVNAWGRPPARYEIQQEHAGERGGPVRFRLVDEGGRGGAHLIFPARFQRGEPYRATLKIRAREPILVDVMLRRDAHPYDPFAIKTVSVGRDWQQVNVEGRVLDPATSLRIAPARPGVDVWVDEVRIAPGDAGDLAPRNSGPIPRTFFGMHLIRLGSHTQWPSFSPGILRLSDTGTTWKDLQPSPGWDFSSDGFRRLDLYLDFVRKHSRDTELLYVLGQTPAWASSDPSAKSAYGLGHNAPPRDLDLWRDYVRTLARRYAGRIRYWELWNEPDFQQSYSGSIADMVEMARIAREELKAVDPNNKLVSPGLTASQGMPWLNNFLAAGGGRYVDIIGFHWYFNTSPERLALAVSNVRQMMANYGQEAKELWNTEGAPGCDSLVFNCSTYVPTAEEIRSTTARAMMIMWIKGVSNFNYYFWERTEPLAKLVESDYTTPTQAGLAYKEVASWMKGARVVDSYRVNDTIYVVRMNRGTENFVVLWSSTGKTTVNLASTWVVSKIRTLLGSESMIPSSRQITIGLEPVLLKP